MDFLLLFQSASWFKCIERSMCQIFHLHFIYEVYHFTKHFWPLGYPSLPFNQSCSAHTKWLQARLFPDQCYCWTGWRWHFNSRLLWGHIEFPLNCDKFCEKHLGIVSNFLALFFFCQIHFFFVIVWWTKTNKHHHQQQKNYTIILARSLTICDFPLKFFVKI